MKGLSVLLIGVLLFKAHKKKSTKSLARPDLGQPPLPPKNQVRPHI